MTYHEQQSFRDCQTRPVPISPIEHPSGELAERSFTATEEVLSSRGCSVSPKQAAALRDFLVCLEAMADGVCDRKYHLSGLDTGLGKTTGVTSFLKCLLRSKKHDEVSVVVFLSRLSEIEHMVKEAELNAADFAVLTADEAINQLSATPVAQARVLFTTQQMLSRRGRSTNFTDAEDFYYEGQVRGVRIWDEALDEHQIVCLSVDEIPRLIGCCRPVDDTIVETLTGFYDRARVASAGAIISVPDVAKAMKRVSAFYTELGEFQSIVDRMAAMSGKSVLVENGRGTERVLYWYCDALPAGLAPMLVLDASGDVKGTYTLSENRGRIKRLKSARKDYSKLTIHVLSIGAGIDSWRAAKNGSRLSAEILEMLAVDPDNPWLIISHKASALSDPKRQLWNVLSASQRETVQFCPYGQHHGTNAFRDVSNLIVAGVMSHPPAYIRVLTYASFGASVGAELPPAAFDKVRSGELGHCVVQAIGRGVSRNAIGGVASPCTVYLIVSKHSKIREKLHEWFPNCAIKEWRPKLAKLSGHVEVAVAYLDDRFSCDPETVISFNEVMTHVGITDKSNFRKCLREHADFRQALSDRQIEEVKVGKGKGRNSFSMVKSDFSPIEQEAEVYEAKI